MRVFQIPKLCIRKKFWTFIMSKNGILIHYFVFMFPFSYCEMHTMYLYCKLKFEQTNKPICSKLRYPPAMKSTLRYFLIFKVFNFSISYKFELGLCVYKLPNKNGILYLYFKCIAWASKTIPFIVLLYKSFWYAK